MINNIPFPFNGGVGFQRHTVSFGLFPYIKLLPIFNLSSDKFTKIVYTKLDILDILHSK